MKSCSKCGVNRPLGDFYKDGRKEGAYRPRCKICFRAERAEKGKENAEYQKIYRANNSEKVSNAAKCRRIRNAHAIRERQKVYRELNREKLLQAKKTWYREKREANPEFFRARARGRYKDATQDQIERRNKYHREWKKKKRARDPLYALTCRVRNRTCAAIRRWGYGKKGKTADILGCSWEHLKAHIEMQFEPGMSWDNRSEWDIDHITPLASANSEEELYSLCNYKNLRPMWERENKSKGAKDPVQWANENGMLI